MRLLYCLFLPLWLAAQPGTAPVVPLDHDFDTVTWTNHLRLTQPSLLLTPERVDTLRSILSEDSTVADYFRGLQHRADALLDVPPLERKLVGRRLLATSREALRRISTLGMVWQMTSKTAYLDRMGSELQAVSEFSDWNPAHFLDVAEMSLAVAIGLDWGGRALPGSVQSVAYDALLNKGLRPAVASTDWWVTTDNNWNQVCHGGAIAAALVLGEREPKLSGQAIARALENLPYALRAYAPDGAYPEGPTYWTYGTSYSVTTIEMLRSALHTDFGLAEAPGFMASAMFRTLSQAPSGDYYNYGDSRADAGTNGAEILAWFAAETQQPAYYQENTLDRVYVANRASTRFSAIAFPWVVRAMQRVGNTPNDDLPLAWSAAGANPISFLRDASEPTFFLAAKGGRASISHGNMDAGSFVFELDGVRWSVDLGIQEYNALEQLGFDLWSDGQDAPRWTLISKNNFNHSTLTVNESLHRVDGYAPLQQTSANSLRIDLSDVFAGQLDAASRSFTKTGPRSLLVSDTLDTSAATESVTWQLMTTANVTLTPYGARLRQGDQWLDVRIEQPAGLQFSVTRLNPPPLSYDMRVSGLQRLELHIPPDLLELQTVLHVRLTGDEPER
ncbi:hypothetical protein LEM8419_02912 [Neolewinella maritima]|uniref:Heparinase II/III-like C-terminal domain-containing protein n=1 Tax=Neolewinella maritima TaxID=1383882 RepID=A0ABM9B422_9BACT|nr:heparinase II/III family protein [Neolewinella maritima]CAH1001997.1 hypothetical protein LEM8419_02912 [Neolewinella maritima]